MPKVWRLIFRALRAILSGNPQQDSKWVRLTLFLLHLRPMALFPRRDALTLRLCSYILTVSTQKLESLSEIMQRLDAHQKHLVGLKIAYRCFDRRWISGKEFIDLIIPALVQKNSSLEEVREYEEYIVNKLMIQVKSVFGPEEFLQLERELRKQNKSSDLLLVLSSRVHIERGEFEKAEEYCDLVVDDQFSFYCRNEIEYYKMNRLFESGEPISFEPFKDYLERAKKITHCSPTQHYLNCEVISWGQRQGGEDFNSYLDTFQDLDLESVSCETAFLELLRGLLPEEPKKLSLDKFLIFQKVDINRKLALNVLLVAIARCRKNPLPAYEKIYLMLLEMNDLPVAMSLWQYLAKTFPGFNKRFPEEELFEKIRSRHDFSMIANHLKNYNPKEASKNPRLVLLTCIWKRPRLTRIVLDYYRNLKTELRGEIELDIVVVGSEEFPGYLEGSGVHYVDFKNFPLSAKWQAGIEYARKLPHDGVVIVGSDDLIPKKLFQKYKEVIRDGYLFFGVRDLVVVDHEQIVFWPGYLPLKNQKRFLETTGAGRLLTKPLLEMMNYQLWSAAAINKGLDRLITSKLEKMGFYRVFPEYCMPLKTSSHQFLIGQSVWGFEDTGAVISDFKVSDENVTSFGSLSMTGDTSRRFDRPALEKQYGSQIISDIFNEVSLEETHPQ